MCFMVLEYTIVSYTNPLSFTIHLRLVCIHSVSTSIHVFEWIKMELNKVSL
jgi:hypothetical protein